MAYAVGLSDVSGQSVVRLTHEALVHVARSPVEWYEAHGGSLSNLG